MRAPFCDHRLVELSLGIADVLAPERLRIRRGFGGAPGRPRRRLRLHDDDTAIAVLRKAVELGVDLIDTADSYGPFVSEDFIREALHPYDGLVIEIDA